MRFAPYRVFLIALVMILSVGIPTPAVADGPQDNLVENVRPMPKPGVEIPEEVRVELTQRLAELGERIEHLRSMEHAGSLLPDVEIFHRAVDQAVRFQEFFDPKEFTLAKQLLATGLERAEQLQQGKPTWTQQTGLVVRGYRSQIDHTVQPYGLVIPEDYQFETGAPSSPKDRRRLDLWFHGRGETLSEVNFLHQRMTQNGEFTPPGVIVLHPYGRYCNANKFAGEIDTFEVLADAQRRYRIDPNRIAVRGFSMGGAACWQFAVHYPGRWFAANPGAGFSETPDFLKVFQNETLEPTWYEQKLWRMYDCTGYAANLAFLPTIAYSGDMDKQKQAADMIEAALKAEGLSLRHVIGPMTAHKLHPDSKVEIDKVLSQWERLGPPHSLKSPYPVEDGWEIVDQFVTYTLRYHESRFIRIDGMTEHWEPARVVLVKRVQDGITTLGVKTSGVTAFSLDVERLLGRNPFQRAAERLNPNLLLDGQSLPLQGGGPGEPRFTFSFHQREGAWNAHAARQSGLNKRHGLQGPIDDAFLSSFLFIKPTGTGLSPEVDSWVTAEFERAVREWRRQMRGDARVKLDTEITRDDMQDTNIVLWGDPRSNEVLSVLAEALPIGWDAERKTLRVGEQTFDATSHLPLMIWPNPLAPDRYVVLNSGFTYREYDYLNNARQTPKLPDWAVVDVRTPPNARYPGKVVAADFFEEQWRWKPPRNP
jgi:pimeloyl-ACP methyl ester carboxylesterase